MTKSEVQQRVLKNGIPLKKSKFKWNEKTLTFSSNEDNLVIDFTGINFCIFITGDNCVFVTGDNCIFIASFNCVFNYRAFITGFNRAFITGNYCVFITSSNRTFYTGIECVCIRSDVYEIIKIPENTKIKQNEYGVKGYVKLDDNED